MTEAEHGRLTSLHRPLPEYIVHTVSLEHSMLWYYISVANYTILIAEIICYHFVIAQCTKMLATKVLELKVCIFHVCLLSR